ncbi:MAG: HK97 family phage prohead protease [Prevotellaceae bacterium]|nr:HK97 family phage prohead protease [Prevotellaceae bacterium]
MSKSKRVRISNESLNSYGTRVLTAGMNIEQYNRNPVLLYMHERGQVIGLVKDLKVEGGEVSGELVFDEATELSRRCKKQWEFGSLKMVSVGIDILETSEDAKYLVQGQTAPTITKSKLFEVSLVDIGANDDAIALHKDGVRLTLGKDAADVLPPLHILNQPKTNKTMDQEKLALTLGLPANADEAAISAAIRQLQAKGEEVDSLKKSNGELLSARIEAMVDAAVNEKKILPAKKQHFVELGKKIGADGLKDTLDAMAPVQKASELISGGASGSKNAEYSKLSDVPAEKLEEMRKNDRAQYRRLYKAEYGFDCDI